MLSQAVDGIVEEYEGERALARVIQPPGRELVLVGLLGEVLCGRCAGEDAKPYDNGTIAREEGERRQIDHRHRRCPCDRHPPRSAARGGAEEERLRREHAKNVQFDDGRQPFFVHSTRILRSLNNLSMVHTDRAVELSLHG